MTVRVMATLCACLACGCHLVLGLEDHEVAASGGGGAPSTGGAGGSGGGGGPSGGVGGGVLHTRTLVVEEDEDDGLWTLVGGEDEERLKFNTVDYRIFVGTDVDNQRVGLRFPIAELAGAKVLSAHLVLSKEAGNNSGSEEVVARVWNTPGIDPFVEGHQHGPSQHADEGLWPDAEVSWTPPMGNALETSPDLAKLVQHIVDHPDFASTPDPHVGFAIFPVPTGAEWYVGYEDSSQGGAAAPRLQLEYIEY
jgi:hypothetical protein